MKYWLFQNNQVNGPYAAEELRELSSFSAESLVCPEGRKGTSMGDWQRAGIISELAACLLKTPQPALSGNFAAGAGALPPDPTLKDLAALGGLKDKVAALENSVSELWEQSRLKDSEIASLNAELAEKKRLVSDLQNQLAGVEEKVGGVAVLRGELDKAVAAEKNVETAVEAQGRSLSGLNGEVSRLKADFQEIDRLKADIKELSEVKAEASEVERLKTDLRALENLKEEPLKKEEVKADETAPALAAAPLPAPVSTSTPAPIPLDIFEATVKLPPRVEALPPVVDIAAAPADAGKPGPGKAKKIMAAGAAAAIALSAAAYFMGLFAPQKKEAPVIEEPLAEEAAPVSEASQEEERKAAALNLVKMFPSASGRGTLDEELQGAALEASGPSPWMAEKISEGVYQVNFYSPKKNAAAAVTYEFEVRLAENKVAPHNEAATHLMAGTKPAPPPAPAPAVKKRKRVKVRPKPAAAEEASAESLFPDETPARAKAEAEPGDDFIDYSLGAGSEPAEREAPAKTKKQEPPSEKPGAVSDAELLDDLLKP